jgi:hypothetical protein
MRTRFRNRPTPRAARVSRTAGIGRPPDRPISSSLPTFSTCCSTLSFSSRRLRRCTSRSRSVEWSLPTRSASSSRRFRFSRVAVQGPQSSPRCSSNGSSAPGRSSRSAGGFGAPCLTPVSRSTNPPRRRPDLSRRPVFGERGQLELVCRGARVRWILEGGGSGVVNGVQRSTPATRGGALADGCGRVVGINTAVAGIGLALLSLRVGCRGPESR